MKFFSSISAWQWLLLLAVTVPVLAQAQSGKTSTPMDAATMQANPGTGSNAAATAETQVNILMSYYQQDGNNGAVEGGQGTQYLTDLTPTIILNVPLDTVSRFTANFGMDVYASASTDRIDFALSTPSASDTRFHADFGYTKDLKARRMQVGLGAGLSKEYDYTSFNVSGSWALTSLDGNRQLGLNAQTFIDQAKLIYPVELRTGQQLVPTNRRQSYNLSIVYSQVVTQRLQVAFSTELVYQHGLLSTPFHRVYFKETGGAIGQAKVESLPSSRIKYPVGIRANYYASDLIQLRTFYRFYNDDFGIRAHTMEVETPVKITPFFVLYPFYRYHTQTAAKYFAGYLDHSIADEFYTSDYDLSAFHANKVGLGMRISPVYGISRFKTPFRTAQGAQRVARFKALDLRYSYYNQSNGLTASLVSADLSFVLP